MALAVLDRTLNLTAFRDLLLPALHGLMKWAGSTVRDVSLEKNFTEDAIDLVVRHRLFTRRDVDDGTYKANFRGRVAKMICADQMPNGRALVVERRSFLARAAKIRKTKPRKIRKGKSL